MEAKGIEQEMYNYFKQLSLAEKKSVVQMLKTFLKRSDRKTGAVSIEDYNKDIDEAMDEVAHGEFYTHDEVTKIAKKW